jgi:hypothetical protein
VVVVVVHAAGTEANGLAWLSGHGVTFPAIQDDEPWTIWPSYAEGDYYYPQGYVIDRNMVVHRVIPGGAPEATIEGYILDAIYDREPVDVELVMDVSSSMNAPSTGDSKLTMMKNATKLVTDFLVDHGQPADRMGLVWFTDGASEYQDAVGDKLLSVPARFGEIKAQIDAHTTGTCTAMGAGLQTAYSTLSASTHQRAVVLCTDGMQNIEPKVTTVAGHLEIVNSGGWLCGPHSGVAEAPGVDIASHDTVVNTIGVGIAATYEPLLQELANQTGGVYLGTHDPATDLDLLYFVDLCNALAGGSPAIVHHNAGVLDAERCRAVESFKLNRSARKFSAMLAWKHATPGSLTFWLRSPCGQILDLHAEMKSFDDHCIATVYLPRTEQGAAIESVGTWQMVVRGETGQPSTEYHAFVIAEDSETRWHIEVPHKPYQVGDLVQIGVVLEESGKLVKKVREIAVEAAVPRVPVAELLAKIELPVSRQVVRRVGRSKFEQDPLALKLEAMMEDPNLSQRLMPVRKRLSLAEGTLSCTFGDRELKAGVPLTASGLNTFKVSILAESKSNGPIARTSVVSVHARPGKVDPKLSAVGVSAVATREASGTLLTVTPRTVDGHLVGPGHGHLLTVAATQRTTGVEVSDMIDGTYQVLVTPPAKTAKGGRQVNLRFDGTTLWKGAV